ncbi:hypothetical protein CCR95_01810 [Thiocystis minor]|uniref:FHA domain-containing protein n=1 Tax=Thiocystis minor TaxID=61597 RepID=UPI00191343CB|nr:FHA domain-containing protein [Thiocystis minor]MBK5962858.1 hypothetical protein [Thiocystis minor]
MSLLPWRLFALSAVLGATVVVHAGQPAEIAISQALAEDDEVSTQHARLSLQGRQTILEDLGSTNRTWLNGVPLSAPHPVRDGDVLRVGQTELRLGGSGR